MSTFSTTVTKAQRNARDFDTREREISICSRQHTNRPGYNPSPYEPKVTPAKSKPWSLGEALKEKILGPSKQEAKHAKLQVRPTTKCGQRSATPTSKDIMLPELPVKTFLDLSLTTPCELATPRDVFIAIHSLSKSKPCVGCSYDVHSKTGCRAKQMLLRERGLLK